MSPTQRWKQVDPFGPKSWLRWQAILIGFTAGFLLVTVTEIARADEQWPASSVTAWEVSATDPHLLTITYIAGPQEHAIRTTVNEGTETVTVTVRTSPFEDGPVSSVIGKAWTTTIRLPEPLSGRPVLDGSTGNLVCPISTPGCDRSELAVET
jgi:hypothetical protein